MDNMNQLRVAHFCTFSPHLCGLYHTTKDLIWAERQLGVDARMVNILVKKKEDKSNSIEYGKISTDGWLTTVDKSWAERADILVLHTAIPDELLSIGKPVIVMCHGRPESSFLLEYYGVLGTWSSYYTRARNSKYSAFVTFWPEFLPILKNYLPEKRLFCVPAPVNLTEYSPFGDVFNFGDRSGTPNIVVADMWRRDVTPFNVIMAADLFRKKYCSTAKLHIIGVPGAKKQHMSVLFYGLQQSGVLGNVAGNMKKVKEIIRAANMVITPHVIATRVIRESLALGTPVVAGTGCRYTPYQANPRDIEGFAYIMNQCWEDYKSDKDFRSRFRAISEKEFDPLKSGKAMQKVFESVLNPISRKVFIDLGGHLGESIDRFYKEVPTASEYEIFTFEPDSENVKVLKDRTKKYSNITYIEKAASNKVGRAKFYRGGVNHGEGGTLKEGKKTGRVDYNHPTTIDTINFSGWLASNFSHNDYIVVKMNIEGGEYDIFESLLKDGTTKMIDQLYVQTHSHKFNNIKFKMSEEYFLRHSGIQVFAKSKGFYPFKGLR